MSLHIGLLRTDLICAFKIPSEPDAAMLISQYLYPFRAPLQRYSYYVNPETSTWIYTIKKKKNKRLGFLDISRKSLLTFFNLLSHIDTYTLHTCKILLFLLCSIHRTLIIIRILQFMNYIHYLTPKSCPTVVLCVQHKKRY